MHTLVVVPTFNEAENIEVLLTRVRAAVPSADILVVDDNSPDGTGDLAEKAGAELGQIKILRRPRKEGLGNAYRAGFRQGLDAGYKVLVQMDADLSHDPDVIPLLLAKVAEGADVAIGSRYVPGGSTPNWPTHRKMLSRYGNRYSGWALGLRLRDVTAGFRAYTAEILEAVKFDDTQANGYAFQTEVGYRISKWGGKITEVPITFTDRERGTSKMSGRIMAESMTLVTWWGLRLRGERLRSRLRKG
jgi:dolichol-phosphate mannosyltransferase